MPPTLRPDPGHTLVGRHGARPRSARAGWRHAPLLVLVLLAACHSPGAAPGADAGEGGGSAPAAGSSSVALIQPLAPAIALDPNAVCRNAYACSYDGRCSLAAAGQVADGEPGRVCVAADDAGCVASRGCRDWGACRAQAGQCVVGSDEHCEKAWICRTKGFCHHEQGRCVVSSDADCKHSELCQYARKCRANSGRCVR